MAIAHAAKSYIRVDTYRVPDEYIDDPIGAEQWLYAQETFPQPLTTGEYEYVDWSLEVEEVVGDDDE